MFSIPGGFFFFSCLTFMCNLWSYDRLQLRVLIVSIKMLKCKLDIYIKFTKKSKRKRHKNSILKQNHSKKTAIKKVRRIFF